MSRQYLIILVILVLVTGICTAVTVPQVNIPAHSSGSVIHSGIQASPLLSKPVSSSLVVKNAIGNTPILETKENTISQTTSGISIESVGDTTRVSVSSTGTGGNKNSENPSISADGRFVTFHSSASNLVSGDGNGKSDVFVHDRNTAVTTRVSVSSKGIQGNGDSYNPSISADGRFVTFHSSASNLVDGDDNGKLDVFVHDRNTAITTRVSVSSEGTQGNGNSKYPSVSSDGRYVAFQSAASNLLDGDGNNLDDVFVHDRDTGETSRVSVSSEGIQGNDDSNNPSISADGRFVTFHSYASNLVNGDGNGKLDVFVHDRNTAITTRVSVSSAGTGGNSFSYNPSISADGRFVTFHSSASNLVDGDDNGCDDVFIHDRNAGETTRISVSIAGTTGRGDSRYPSISADGMYVAFYSYAPNLVSGDGNGCSDIFIYHRNTGENIRVSVNSAGTGGNNYSYHPSISEDGMYVAFDSLATNLVSDDGNDSSDIFVHDCGSTPVVESITPSSGVNTEPVSIIDLSGSGFLERATVTLTRSGRNPITATDVTIESSTKISCTFPITGAIVGEWNMVVKNNGGYSGILENGFTINNPKPTISSISPNNEIVNTNTVDYPVTVTGTNFVSGCTATMNGGDRDVTFVSDTNLTVTFLKGDDDSAGSYPLIITNLAPSAGASVSFNYVIGNPAPTITSINPATGVNTGTVSFTNLAGTNFRAGAKINLTRSGQVNIPATDLTISSTKINGTFNLNGKTAGTWNVVVTNTDGQSATKTNGFTIQNPKPTISSLSPNNEVANTHTANYLVTVTGTNFVSGCTATLKGQNRAVTYTSSTKVTVTFLKGDDDKAASYPVVITNPSPSAGASSSFNYIVGNPVPTITGITPAIGVNTGTVSATITGKNFKAGATVKLTKAGKTAITGTGVSVKSSGKITCKLPVKGKTSGKWNVVITNKDGQKVTKTNGFTITGPVPVITSVSPKTGSMTKNTQVTISGKNFRSGASVKMVMGATARTGIVKSLGSTKIVCVLPTKNAKNGTWGLKITNSDTSSVTKMNLFLVK